jgi:hypothetical protein
MNKDDRREWHLSFLPSAFTVQGKKRMVSSYGAILYGFAAWLIDEELYNVSRKPGFGQSFPAGVRHPATTRTPDFFGLNKAEAYVWNNSNYGKRGNRRNHGWRGQLRAPRLQRRRDAAQWRSLREKIKGGQNTKYEYLEGKRPKKFF